MAIGFRELLVLLVLSAIPFILILAVVWFAIRWSRRPRPVAERLADLESLRQAGRISTDEYEKQRSAIIASI